MGHASELGLQEAQRTAIKAEVQKAQSRFIDLQWEAKEQTEKMAQLLKQAPINEARVLEQADRVMALEHDIKKAQLTLLIRMKTLLTAELISKLDAVRR